MAKKDEAERGPLLTSDAAGKLLMISAERVRQLAKEGWITKTGKNQYHLNDVVQGYIRYRNDADRRATKSASSTRVSDARAREIELRVAERERRLVQLDDAVAIIEELCGMFRTAMSGFAARITRDLQFRKQIDAAVNDILGKLAIAAEKRSRSLSEGGDIDAPIGGDDAGPVGGEE
jgi:hypothetical protein